MDLPCVYSFLGGAGLAQHLVGINELQLIQMNNIPYSLVLKLYIMARTIYSLWNLTSGYLIVLLALLSSYWLLNVASDWGTYRDFQGQKVTEGVLGNLTVIQFCNFHLTSQTFLWNKATGHLPYPPPLCPSLVLLTLQGTWADTWPSEQPWTSFLWIKDA